MRKTSNSLTGRSLSHPVAVITSVAACLLGLVACSDGGDTTQPKELHSYPYLTVTSTFGDILDHPAFAGFSLYMIPTENTQNAQGLRPLTVESLPPLVHAAWDPQTMIDGLNFMIDQVNAGDTIFYPLYSEKQIAADDSKKAAGMFFIPGDPAKPLAVIAAGGAFRAVVSIQEAFPHAKAMHELGYNVAILKYRVNSFLVGTDPATPEQTATAVAWAKEDMAAAMQMLRDNTRAWHISLDHYSVWGSSAGGVIMSAWASNGPDGATAHGFHPPAVVVNAYTPSEQIEASESLPPYFVTIAADDDTVSVPGVDAFVDRLKAAGVEVEYERYPSGGHGFGLGVGTSAYGWFDHAIAFWEAHS
jgi:acetyl esterase/lipase